LLKVKLARLSNVVYEVIFNTVFLIESVSFAPIFELLPVIIKPKALFHQGERGLLWKD
jgi:hypothetical protein